MTSPELYGSGEFGSRGNDQPFSMPMFEATGWEQFDGHAWESFANDRQVEVSYINAGTCPDCGGGMIRLGHCMSCPCCGYGSCGE